LNRLPHGRQGRSRHGDATSDRKGRLRILPNHACATGAQFSEYQAITAHGVAQQWRRFDGW